MTAPQPIWRYVPAAEYVVPSSLSTDTLRGLRRVWKTALAAVRSPRGPEGQPRERSRPPSEVLAGLLPDFDADAMSGALAAALEDRPDLESAERRVQVVIGPPGSRTGQVVAALARRRGWGELPAPARADLLGGAEAIRDPLRALEPESTRPVAIPELHRWLLRSERGLPLLRVLLERLRDPSSPVLIGCDSWAWSFLDRTVGGDLLGAPLALAALDAPALESWLGSPLRSKGLVCRSLEKPDEPVFGPPPDERSQSDGGSQALSAALVKLASAARGNPATARELWRRCLRVEDGDRESADPKELERENTLWAAPAKDSETVIPPQLEAVHRFVLHAVLLHGGLERELLPEVLPFPRHDLLRRLRDLLHQGLLLEERGAVSVAPAAYPEVRGYLRSEGFLVDDF